MAREDKKSFVLYFNYRNHLALLTDEERGKLLMALLDYGETGAEPELEGATLMAFSFIACQMNRDAQKYEETCRKRSEAGKKGGRPRKSDTEEESEEKQTEAKKANGFLKKQTKAKKADNDNENDNENDNDIVYPLISPQGETPTEKTDKQEERFAEFWAEYPKKVGKEAARKSWKRIKPDAELFEHIMQAVVNAKSSEQWIRESGRYIPNPSTWLNQGRWDDELTPAETNQPPSWQQEKRQTSGGNPFLSLLQMKGAEA